MHIFYEPNIDESTTDFVLNETESKHACKVLRLQVNDQIVLVNGKGLHATATIVDAHPKHCKISIVSRYTETPPSYSVHIAICPTKMNDRLEWFVEKATELGVDEITFLLSKNSERKAIKLERFQSIAISAMKQSKRLFLPKINDLTKAKDFFEKNPNGYIAHCYEGEKNNLINIFNKTSPIAIGPEGDFTLEECKIAKNNGYQEITLGKNRLRTETAGLYACMQALSKL